jgi:hypothetical protein
VIKHVINDDGGTATASNFTLDSGGVNDTPDNFAGAEAPGTTVTLDAGSYAVTETGPSGYTRSDSADCTGSIAVGQTKTCTITNDDPNQVPIITEFSGTDSLVGGPGSLVFVASTFSGKFTDTNINDDPWTAFWSWDGSPFEAQVPTYGSNSTNTHDFSNTHTFTTVSCTHKATVKITDKDGGTSVPAEWTVKVGTGAFLPPMTNQPVTNKLKNGQVLPVKIQIKDCNGAGVNNLAPAIKLFEGDQTSVFDDTAVTIPADSVSAVDTNGVMRSSGSDGSYIYNLRINVPANKLGQDYTVVIYPYGTTGAGANQTLRHVIQATK